MNINDIADDVFDKLMDDIEAALKEQLTKIGVTGDFRDIEASRLRSVGYPDDGTGLSGLA